MRIIIEVDKDGNPVQMQTEVESDAGRESDGGASPALLPGAQTSLPASEGATGVAKSGGPPPDWLVQAIDAAMAAEGLSHDEPTDKDGGAAPS